MSPHHASARSLTVLDPGGLATVQDAGRPGLAHLGVPRSGWLDEAAARAANRLVGNTGDEAVLEVVLGGLRVRAECSLTVAVTGAGVAVWVGSRPVGYGEAVTLRAGQELRTGRPEAGLRVYLAVGGGVACDPVLGSRSTDTLSRLGPAPVAAGTVLAVGPRVGEPPGVQLPWPSVSAAPLRLHPGPRLDWFAPDTLDRLGAAPYRVQPDSDRIGLRLEGAPLERVRPGELPSEGIVLGAVQVPPSGQPVLFLADHPTTGGYPVVAVLDSADLGRCAQLRPGDEVRFVPARPR